MLEKLKPHHKWIEPSSFRRAFRPPERTMMLKQLPYTLLYFGLFAFLWFTSKRGNEEYGIGPFAGVILAAGIAFFLTSGVRWLHYLAPSFISVSKVALLRQNGLNNQLWRYSDLSECEALGFSDSNDYLILNFKNQANQLVSSVGMKKKEDVESVLATLAQKGIEIRIHNQAAHTTRNVANLRRFSD
ncbi:MAG: hypothetical protein ABQ298_04040 [Puniceicoccaceae bacterium]